MEGPDHRASSSENEFSDLAKNVRRAEIILGSAQKHCQEEERQMASVSRSIVLSRDCSKGTIIKADHLSRNLAQEYYLIILVALLAAF